MTRKDVIQQTDPRDEHYKTFHSISRLVNPRNEEDEEVKRVGSSFPCSVDYLGNVVSCCSCGGGTTDSSVGDGEGGFSSQCEIHQSTKQKTNDISGENCNPKSKDARSCCEPRKKDNHKEDIASRDCYIGYTGSDAEDTWSDSYRYLLKVLARRIETVPTEIQSYVLSLEDRIFNYRK